VVLPQMKIINLLFIGLAQVAEKRCKIELDAENREARHGMKYDLS
jgi:hypothetical protein